MVEPRPIPSPFCELDRADAHTFRSGFPSALVTRLRGGAPVFSPPVLARIREIEPLGPAPLAPQSIRNPARGAPREPDVRLA